MISDEIQYEDIPADARASLDELYDREGAVIWWNARNKLLDGQRARDVPDRAIALLHALADGAFL